MPLFGVNMAVPVPIKENRESQIYFLTSFESVRPGNDGKKYIIFKISQLVISICCLVLLAFSLRNSKNTIENMLICAMLGALIIYPFLFILFLVHIRRRPLHMILINIIGLLSMVAVAGRMTSSWWNERNYSEDTEETNPDNYYPSKEQEATMKLTSSVISVINGLLYMIESLIMYIEVREYL